MVIVIAKLKHGAKLNLYVKKNNCYRISNLYFPGSQPDEK